MYTLKELRERKSVRGYTDESLSESIRNTLNAEATFINSHEAGLNFQVRYDDTDPFRGLTRSYGMFRGVRNYLAVVIDSTFEFALERAGYFAEGYVMKAVSLGLGTCFVGGTFSRSSSNSLSAYGDLSAFDRQNRSGGSPQKEYGRVPVLRGECEGICRSITEVSMASEGNQGGGMRSFGFECASCTYLCGIG